MLQYGSHILKMEKKMEYLLEFIAVSGKKKRLYSRLINTLNHIKDQLQSQLWKMVGLPQFGIVKVKIKIKEEYMDKYLMMMEKELIKNFKLTNIQKMNNMHHPYRHIIIISLLFDKASIKIKMIMEYLDKYIFVILL